MKHREMDWEKWDSLFLSKKREKV